jgi:hypothetical protein
MVDLEGLRVVRQSSMNLHELLLSQILAMVGVNLVDLLVGGRHITRVGLDESLGVVRQSGMDLDKLLLGELHVTVVLALVLSLMVLALVLSLMVLALHVVVLNITVHLDKLLLGHTAVVGSKELLLREGDSLSVAKQLGLSVNVTGDLTNEGSVAKTTNHVQRVDVELDPVGGVDVVTGQPPLGVGVSLQEARLDGLNLVLVDILELASKGDSRRASGGLDDSSRVPGVGVLSDGVVTDSDRKSGLGASGNVSESGSNMDIEHHRVSVLAAIGVVLNVTFRNIVLVDGHKSGERLPVNQSSGYSCSLLLGGHTGLVKGVTDLLAGHRLLDGVGEKTHHLVDHVGGGKSELLQVERESRGRGSQSESSVLHIVGYLY